MNRRRFLKASGFVLGAGALAFGAGIWAVQPRRQTLPLPDGNGSRPLHPSARKRVVVVGGELTAWTVRALGEEFPVEHGFHGFFAQYYNLRALLDAAGVRGDLAPSPGYPVLFADRPAETFGRTTHLFPFNMLSVVRQSHALKLGDFRHDGDGLNDLMKYDGARTFERYDGVDFARFAIDGRINRPMVETVLEPFGKTTLNR